MIKNNNRERNKDRRKKRESSHIVYSIYFVLYECVWVMCGGVLCWVYFVSVCVCVCEGSVEGE